METAIDLLTGENFTKNRINQKFSKRENRIKYYNKKATDLRNYLNYINKPLFQNYKVLSALMNNKTEEEFHKQYLIGRGFDFKVITHFSIYNEIRLPNIYNYKIQSLENERIKIIKE
jgi:hypothetical protein